MQFKGKQTTSWVHWSISCNNPCYRKEENKNSKHRKEEVQTCNVPMGKFKEKQGEKPCNTSTTKNKQTQKNDLQHVDCKAHRNNK